MIGGFDIFKDWWKPSSYTAWWAYAIGMPIVACVLLYIAICNGLYRMFNRR